MGALKGLSILREPCEVELFTDSQYLRNAVEKGWLKSWQKNSWRKADKKPVLNADLWLLFLEQMTHHSLTMHWLRGHAGHPENERCDELARQSANQENLPIDEAFEKNRS